MKKRKIFAAIILIVICLAGVVFGLSFGWKKSKDPMREQKEFSIQNDDVESENNLRKHILFYGFEQLDDIIPEADIEKITAQIEEDFFDDEVLNDIGSITCKSSMETENQVLFYCTLDTYDTAILYCRYEKKNGVFKIWTEEKSEAEAANEWMDQKAAQTDISEWPEEDELPQPWDYIEYGIQQEE